MAAIRYWEEQFENHDDFISSVMNRDATCFLCGQLLSGSCVYWSGESLLVLHSRCAFHLGTHLTKDAYQAETGIRIPNDASEGQLLECMGHNWRRRIRELEVAKREESRPRQGDAPASRGVVVLREALFIEDPGSRVYFIQQEPSGPIKIGVSRDVGARLSQLQSSSPQRLRVLGHVRGGVALESHLHELFKDQRLKGEWFESSPDLLGFIEQLVETTQPAP